MKKILAVAALTLMCSSAFAQTQPAPGASSSGNVGPGATPHTQGGAMQHNNIGSTTGNAMKPDASQQGAPTGAAVNSRGDATEPGKVKDGASSR